MTAAHVRKHGHKALTPTLPLLRYWWRRINAEVFGSALLPCQLSIARIPANYMPAVGLCWDIGEGRAHIQLPPTQTTRVAFIATVAHEMVHQYQIQHRQPIGHGASFDAWKVPIFATIEVHI